MSGEGILFTGARGYLGARLLQALPAARALSADITDPQALTRAIDTAGSFTVLIHLAAANEITCAEDLARAFTVNCIGTRNLLEAAAGAGVRRVVFFSTFHVYGEPADGDTITEATLPNALHPYGITKLAAEQLCKAAARRHGFELAIVRVSNGVGAPAYPEIGRWTLVLLDLCRQAHEKRSLTLLSSGVQRRDFVSLDDISAALGLLLSANAEALRPPVFNLGSGVTAQIREVAALVQEEYRALYGEAVPLSAPAPSGPAPATFRYDFSRLARLGFVPRTDLRLEVRNTLRFCEQFRR